MPTGAADGGGPLLLIPPATNSVKKNPNEHLDGSHTSLHQKGSENLREGQLHGEDPIMKIFAEMTNKLISVVLR